MLALTRRTEERCAVGGPDTLLRLLSPEEAEALILLGQGRSYVAEAIRKVINLLDTPVWVKVVRIQTQEGLRVKLGFDAPDAIPVDREEVYEAKRNGRDEATKALAGGKAE